MSTRRAPPAGPPPVPVDVIEQMAAMPAMVPVDWCPTHRRYLTSQERDDDGCVPCILEVLAGGNPMTVPPCRGTP